jgi:putative PIN family toxin of toxin-antitoxin system
VKVVLDTNVLVSGIFFGGQPRAVLDAWAADRIELVLTPSIFDEYVRTCDRLGATREGLKYEAILATIIGHGTLVADIIPSAPITADPHDDKFMSCALAHGAIVISGDHHLLDVSGWEGVRVMRPNDFLDYLESPDVS